MAEFKDKNEISLMDYVIVLFKHKKSIIFITLLPTLLVALITLLSPDKYQLTYCYSQSGEESSSHLDNVYIKEDRYFDLEKYFKNQQDNTKDQYILSNWNFTQKNYQIYRNWFYSNSNMLQIIDMLKKNKLNEYAQRIETASNHGRDAVQKLIDFSVSPQFVNISKTTDPEKLKGLSQIKAELLLMSIYSKDKNRIYDVADVIRNNLENILPLCIFEQLLKTNTRNFYVKMNEIEENKFQLEIQLDSEKETLKKLRNLNDTNSKKNQDDLKLNFSLKDQIEFLPIENHIQAIELKIIELEKKLYTTNIKHNYLQDLLDLNQKLLQKLNASLFSTYKIHDFRNELKEMIDLYEQQNLKNYLVSLNRKIENRISLNTPVTEQPKVTKLSKSVVKKSAAVFFVALLFSFFIAFFHEHLKQNYCKKN